MEGGLLQTNLSRHGGINFRRISQTHNRIVYYRSQRIALRGRLPAHRGLRFSFLRVRHGVDAVVQWRRRYLDAYDYQLVCVLVVGTPARLRAGESFRTRTSRRVPGDHDCVFNAGDR